MARETLKHPPVEWTGQQALAVAKGFAEAIRKAGMIIFACAILPNHTHFVIERHRYCNETLVRLLKSAAARELLRQRMHPFQAHRQPNGSYPSCWGAGFYQRFLNTEADIDHRIAYVENNPLKEGKRRQRWSFVVDRER
jgi:REP element-mobilizing transposase RayT